MYFHINMFILRNFRSDKKHQRQRQRNFATVINSVAISIQCLYSKYQNINIIISTWRMHKLMSKITNTKEFCYYRSIIWVSVVHRKGSQAAERNAMESTDNDFNSLVRAQIFGLAVFAYDIVLGGIIFYFNGLPMVDKLGFSTETEEILRNTVIGILIIDFVVNCMRSKGISGVLEHMCSDRSASAGEDLRLRKHLLSIKMWMCWYFVPMALLLPLAIVVAIGAILIREYLLIFDISLRSNI